MEKAPWQTVSGPGQAAAPAVARLYPIPPPCPPPRQAIPAPSYSTRMPQKKRHHGQAGVA